MLISFNKIIDHEDYKNKNHFINNLIVTTDSWDITNIHCKSCRNAVENDILLLPHQVTLILNTENLLEVHFLPDTIETYDNSLIYSEYVRSIIKNSMFNLVTEYFNLKLNTLENPIGSIKDIIIDTCTWSVAAFISDSRNWIPMNGRDVLIPSDNIITTDWLNNNLLIGQRSAMLQSCPELDLNDGILLLDDYIQTKEHYTSFSQPNS